MPKDLPIWNHFEESKYGYKIAVCNYCHRELSYKTTITNLKAHLKQRHNDIYNEFLNFAKNPESQSPERKPSNDESDVEEPNNTYQEVVYLYDSDSKSTKKEVTPVRPKKMETQTPMVIQKEREMEKEKAERDKKDGNERRKRRRMSMFVDEEPPAAKSDGEGDEEIDKFGKYVVCLMKTIPKELCAQLQMDMINLIMTSKIKYMAKPAGATDGTGQDSFVVMNEGGKIEHMQVPDDGAEKTTERDANEQGSYEEVVYLQDSDTKTVKEIRLKKLDGLDKKQESEHRKRRLNAIQEKPVDEEEIEKFGKYVTCLMKTIPNEMNTQLQMDIINTIMRGKIRYMTKPTPVPQTEVIIEKVQSDFQPSIIVSMANENAHMPFLETNTVVASQA